MPKKIITIVGARPQFIKAAAVSRKIREHSDLKEIIVHTGQHYDHKMSDVFFEEMEIPTPDYNLQIHGLSHGAMTGQMMEKIETVLIDEKPDWVLVYGDTNSTLAGALAASKLHMRVAHVEAGLRSYNMLMPEEINRILTDRLSTLLLCPTQQAINNLKKEGYDSFQCTIAKTGDVMLDAALYYLKKAKKPELNLPSKFILATIHRAENTDNPDRLQQIMEAFSEISKDIEIIIPLHPRTRKLLDQSSYSYNKTGSRVFIIDPVGYLEMIYLTSNATLVMTDSGGLQKEAYFFQKPCLTLRDETEWVELVESGTNMICGFVKSNIIQSFKKITQQKLNFSKNLYGTGDASGEIIQFIKNHNG